MVDLVAKHRNYVSRVAVAADNFMSAHEDLAALQEEYVALDLGSKLLPAAFEGGNSHMDLASVVAVMVTFSLIEDLLDTGHRGNLLEVRR